MMRYSEYALDDWIDSLIDRWIFHSIPILIYSIPILYYTVLCCAVQVALPDAKHHYNNNQTSTIY